MRFFLCAVLIFCATLAHCEEDEWVPKTSAEIKEIRAECLKAHPLTEEQITRMKNFDFPDDQAVREYLLCSAIKMHIFCEHEGFHPERIAKQFKMDMEESEVLEIAKGCVDKNEQGSPVDVWAFRGHQCFMNSKIGDKVKAYIKKRTEEAEKASSE